ncbi:hypothetical protein E4H12_04200 [Candidatus Thorarchaeota archaeon]|nr:MAG: hypothetical protein E4H12_04200 [Candidatus Thorarchaeota archaeon]
MGNLRTNVIENPSFEDWTGGAPDGYTSIRESGYTDVDYAYAGAGVTGNYAALLEVQGSPTDSTVGQLWINIPSSPNPLVEPGISLSFDWNTLANPDMFQGSFVEIQVFIQTGSDYRTIIYILSHDTYSPTNDIHNAYFSMNDSLSQWNPFAVNITEDYIAGFGAGDLSSTHYITSVRFQAYSPTGATGLIQVAFDNVVLTDESYSAWIGNGDFETGVESPWLHQVSDRAYIEQSMDSTLGSYSLNMSIPVVTSGSGYAILTERFDYPGGYLASSMGETIFELDWKYNDTPSAGDTQNSYLLLRFRNQTAYYDMYLFFGTHNDVLPGFNSTFSKFFKIPGFGVRDTWQHLSLDIYEYMTYAGYTDTSLYEIRLYAENSAIGATVDALFDDFRLITYPLGDPGFEADWYSDSATPFAGWVRWNGETGVISRTTDSLLGTFACNLTVAGVDFASVYRNTYIPVHPSDLTNFSWRLDDMGVGTAHADVEFRFSDGNILNYILGSGVGYGPTNNTNYKYVFADSFNTTGQWKQFAVNLTADVEEAFGLSSDLFIDRLIIESASPSGERVSCIFDEMHFIDAVAPIVDSVDFTPATPMYYESVDVTVYAHDDRSGIQTLYVDYYDGSSWYGLPATDMGGYYEATIPAQAYGTTVEFQVSVTDNSGLNTLDNNGGARYSYTVDDDIIPVVSFTAPTFFEEVEGQVLLDLSAVDIGSGVAFVEFYLDDGATMPLIFNDTIAPYEYTWDSDSVALGDYTIYANVVDNAGVSNGDIVNVTVVDTTPPNLDHPADIEFTVGETGYMIDWNPTDVRPYGYVVYVDDIITYFGNWNSSSEHITVELDDLAVGTYNYTCVVVDGTINGAIDTVIVTVNAESTTPTITTTDPTGGGDILTPLLIIAGIGVAAIVLVIFVVLPKMKSK